MIEICSFSPEYASGVANVILPIQQGEFGISISLEQQPDLLKIKSFYQSGAGNFWVALSAGEVVGTIALLDIGDQQAALRKLFVKPAFRGATHQVAARLLDTLLQWGESKELREIFLGTTEQFHAAHRFYEKHGFREITRSTLPESFSVMSVDSKFYAFTLACGDKRNVQSGGI